VLKPEGKRQLGKPRHRWNNNNNNNNNNNIRMDLTKIRWKGVDWIDMVQYRDKWWAVVDTGMNSQVPFNAGNFWTEDYLLLNKDSALWS